MSKIMKNGRVYGGTQSGGTSYVAGNGIEIASGDVLNVLVDDESLHFDPTYNYAYVDGKYRTIFVGTQSTWDALISEVKATYELVCINDAPDWTGNIDSTPTENSNNAVSSGGVYTALQDKANKTDIASDIQNVYEVMGKNGAKNLLPSIKTSKTVGNVTFTLNGDGSITANGTASSTIYVDLVTSQSFLGQGNYVLSGGVNANQFIYVNTLNSGTYVDTIARAEGEDAVFSINYSGYNQLTVGISIASGQSVDYVTFYPMIRLASDPDNTYEPYAMTNQQITPYVQAISNPNLLDNPWFTVNQRGQSSYTTNNTTIKTVDRWYINAPTERTMNVTDDGVNFPNGMESFYETLDPELTKKLKGRIVTLSVLFSGTPTSSEFFGMIADGHNWIKVSQCYFINAQNGLATITFELPNYTDTDRYHVWMYIQSNLTIKAVKLELGTVSTLAMDTVPSYATELLKCQRYFERIGGMAYQMFGSGIYESGEQFTIYTKIQPKRVEPIATLSGTVYCWDGTHIGSSGLQTTLMSVVQVGKDGNGRLSFTVSGGTTGQVGMAQFRDTTSHIDFSADL